MNKGKSVIISIILAAVIFTLFFCVFQFERKAELYSNINPVKDKLKKIKILKIGQLFKVDKEIDAPGFNQISIALIKPRGKTITCDFNIRAEKNGEILASKTIILKKKNRLIISGKFHFQSKTSNTQLLITLKYPAQISFIPMSKNLLRIPPVNSSAPLLQINRWKIHWFLVFISGKKVPYFPTCWEVQREESQCSA